MEFEARVEAIVIIARMFIKDDFKNSSDVINSMPMMLQVAKVPDLVLH